MSLPMPVTTTGMKKKFKIQVIVDDKNGQKPFAKTIYFGEADDFIFTKNRKSRLVKLGQLKHKDNPLHGHYWRAHLCFKSESFMDNYFSILKPVLAERFPLLK